MRKAASKVLPLLAALALAGAHRIGHRRHVVYERQDPVDDSDDSVGMVAHDLANLVNRGAADEGALRSERAREAQLSEESADLRKKLVETERKDQLLSSA